MWPSTGTTMYCIRSHQVFDLLKSPQLDILAGLVPSDRAKVRSMVVEMVLATSHEDPITHDHTLLPATSLEGIKKPQIDYLLAATLRVAELSHACRPQEIRQKWATRRQAERSSQTREEFLLGLTHSPLAHHSEMGREQRQFEETLVRPAVKCITNLLGLGFMLEALDRSK
eukprot:NODE_3832_length_725_cov_83.857988_g3232_i0.p1 GENE.NODE_3832_length_725_cov_83.857988_g3232_i0~~NODE_3832_length_725_cov_83.857988_g3232_i0.p1  ORF type:complete len:171 (+),score=36.63 NODE_3832_length_725_cov_83.857988_g3232_i0:120-632(+)